MVILLVSFRLCLHGHHRLLWQLLLMVWLLLHLLHAIQTLLLAEILWGHFRRGGHWLEASHSHGRGGKLDERDVEVPRHAVLPPDERHAEAEIAPVSNGAPQYDGRLHLAAAVLDVVAVAIQSPRGGGDELAHHVERALEIVPARDVEDGHGLELLFGVGRELGERDVAVDEGPAHGRDGHAHRT